MYLLDNIPTWRTSIDSLLLHAAEKHEEFVAEYARLVNEAKPRRRRNPSNASIHTGDDEAATDPVINAEGIDRPSSPDPRYTSPLEAGNKYLYAQARRKRKPGTSIRSGASGPQKFRNKNHVVVYYDGYLQEQLDSMVKQVGVARNNLRKGKAALAAATGFRLPTLTSKASHGLSMLDDVRPALMTRTSAPVLPGKKLNVSLTSNSADDESSFLRADKELEQIQSLCETAAHQSLRDGDCRTELDHIRQKFASLLVQATMTADSLKKLQEEQKASQEESSESERPLNLGADAKLSAQPSFELLNAPSLSVSKDLSPLGFGLKPEGLFSAPALLTAPTAGDTAALTSDTIEVDDASDQESIVVDLSQYLLTNPRRVRA